MYDLIILGGGPAGYHAAEKAGAAGLNTVLIEKDHLGGVCLNQGCIPSKTILHSSKLYSQARHSRAFGVSAENVTFDLAAVMSRKEKIIDTLRKGIAFSLKKSKVTVVNGQGMILPGADSHFRVQVGQTLIEGKKLLIGTGSVPILPPIPGAGQDFVYTNKEILNVTALPEKLTVVGGGVIGLELATFFAETGSQVTIIELLPDIATPVDKELTAMLKREMTKKGIVFHLESKVTSIGAHTVTFESKDGAHTIDADIVLMSVGRKAVTQSIGLENIAVACNKGAILTDRSGRTNIPGVWAAGDVNGQSMLAHTAYREADACVHDMLGKNDIVDYDAIPAVIYTHPEVATVGLTKESAEARGYETTVLKLPLSFSGRYLAETDGDRGLCKIVIDSKSHRILGAHIIGGPCSEMIFGLAHMITGQNTAEQVLDTVFPHPTVSEIIKDTLGSGDY